MQEELQDFLLELLAPLRQLIVEIAKALKEATKGIEEAVAPERPKGLGALTSELISREVGDWHRFSNRRQVVSYTGLCPREDSSGGRRFQGSINKHGNPRLRRLLVETVWRLILFQPNYCRFDKWYAELKENKGKLPPGRKKKLVVAIARQFMIDLWRIKTGRCTCKDLGLILAT